MKSTKEEIELKISKRVKVWLSLILCTIFAIVATIVLVNRHNTLVASKNQSSQQGNSPNHEAPQGGTDYASSSTTAALVELSSLGGIYSAWFGTYLDSNNHVSQTKLNLTDTNFAMLEQSATLILQTIQTDYLSHGKTLTAENVTDSDNLMTYINDFKNLLNDFAI